MRWQSTAYILHRYPADGPRICLDLFTYERGRMMAWFKPTAHFRKNQMGILQPFVSLWLEWKNNRVGQLETLEPIEFFTLKKKSLLCGVYLNSLLMQVIKKEFPLEQLFVQYTRTIHALSTGNFLAPALRIFEKKLLAELGYGLNLKTDILGKNIESNTRYLFEPMNGFARIEDLNAPPPIFDGQTLMELENEHFFSQKSLQEARVLLQKAIRYYFPVKLLS